LVRSSEKSLLVVALDFLVERGNHGTSGDKADYAEGSTGVGLGVVAGLLRGALFLGKADHGSRSDDLGRASQGELLGGLVKVGFPGLDLSRGLSHVVVEVFVEGHLFGQVHVLVLEL